MPITIVVGGQYGSEGKGKVAAWLVARERATVVVRSGGSNSGHTVIDHLGRPLAFRHLPTACLQERVYCVIAAGTYIDVEVLEREMRLTRLPINRLLIDPHAVVIDAEDKRREARSGLVNRIGSTGSGTGAALIRRTERGEGVTFAKDHAELRRYVRDAKDLIGAVLAAGERVILEGTQGFGLSLLHADSYPHVTSRDTTAAAFLSEAGLSPLDVDDIVLVIRAHPIRVAGASGPLPGEITWEEVSAQAGRGEDLREFTTVTGQLRRVANFDPDIVRQAIRCNRPTRIALNHMDYINEANRQRFVGQVTEAIGQDIDLVGRSPAHLEPNPYRHQRQGRSTDRSAVGGNMRKAG